MEVFSLLLTRLIVLLLIMLTSCAARLKIERVGIYGRDFTNSTRGCDEECERELELNNDQEEELKNEVPLMQPMSEKPWPFTTALTCRNPLDLPPVVGVKWLGEFVEKFVEPNTLANIKEFCIRHFQHDSN